MNPTGPNLPLPSMPCFITAQATTDGQIWIYRSVLVRDTDPAYTDLWATIITRNGKPILADQFDDKSMMFGKAILEVWQV